MYAIIDLGSNTVRLNIYKVKNHILQLKSTAKETIGLAAYIEADYLTDEGLDVAIQTVTKFIKDIKETRVKKAYLIATAVIRKAKNKDVFLDALKPFKMLDVHLLSGKQEATYDFHAVFLDAPETNGIVVDIGGGSTEIVIYKDSMIQQADAIPIGSLSSYMEHVEKLIPGKKAQKHIKKRVKNYLTEKGFKKPGASYIIHGVGGTMRATRKLLFSGHDYNDHTALPMEWVKPLIADISSKEKAAYLRLIRTVPERIHTIGTGLIILDAIHEYFQSNEMRIFTQGVREGFMIKQLENDYPELMPLGIKI